MQVATGKSILNGIAIGPLRIYKKEEVQAIQTSNRTPAQEWERFENARAKSWRGCMKRLWMRWVRTTPPSSRFTR